MRRGSGDRATDSFARAASRIARRSFIVTIVALLGLTLTLLVEPVSGDVFRRPHAYPHPQLIVMTILTAMYTFASASLVACILTVITAVIAVITTLVARQQGGHSDDES